MDRFCRWLVRHDVIVLFYTAALVTALFLRALLIELGIL